MADAAATDRQFLNRMWRNLELSELGINPYQDDAAIRRALERHFNKQLEFAKRVSIMTAAGETFTVPVRTKASA